MPVVLNGTELVIVQRVVSSGAPSAVTEQTTTQAIANLGAGGGGGGGTGQEVNTTPFSATANAFILNVDLNIPGPCVINVNPSLLAIWVVYTVKDAASLAGSGSPIQIVPSSGLIDNQASYSIVNNDDAVDFYTDGTNLFTK